MGLFSWFRRKREGRDPELEVPRIGTPMGDIPPGATSDFDPGDGGPHLLAMELDALRWVAQAEATNIIRRDPDPLLWKNAEMSFEHERALAFGHEGLRSRTADIVSKQLFDSTEELYDRAMAVADARERLLERDDDLARERHTWDEMYKEVVKNPIEVGRYYSRKSTWTVVSKYVVALILVLSELYVTYALFQEIRASDGPDIWFFSLGAIVLFCVIPHFVAHGMKEGHTRHHAHEVERLRETKRSVSTRVARNSQMEEQDDKGFRRTSVILGLVLVALMVPLARLRAEHIADSTSLLWAAFYFLLQLSISGYFFLREWLDHGFPSHTLRAAERARAEAIKQRHVTFGVLSQAVSDFYTEARSLAYLVRSAPSWDAYVVSTYFETVHWCRHLVVTGRPDLAPFVAVAEVPVLSGVDAASYFADSAAQRMVRPNPITNEQPLLDQNNVFGRNWWLSQLAEALTRIPAVRPDGSILPDPTSDDVSWALSHSPAQLLHGFMEYFGLDGRYVPPSGARPNTDWPSEPVDEVAWEPLDPPLDSDVDDSTDPAPPDGSDAPTDPDEPSDPDGSDGATDAPQLTDADAATAVFPPAENNMATLGNGLAPSANGAAQPAASPATTPT